MYVSHEDYWYTGALIDDVPIKFSSTRVVQSQDYYRGLWNRKPVKIAAITYNHLRLTDSVVKASTNEYVKYIYDATGRKLAKCDYQNGVLKRWTDYLGDLYFESDCTGRKDRNYYESKKI